MKYYLLNFSCIFMIRGVVHQGLKMASADVVKRLETRAIAAEQMIQMLSSQINEIRSFSSNKKPTFSTEHNEIKALSIENAQLKKKIEEQKKLLVAAETKAGIKQVSSQTTGKETSCLNCFRSRNKGKTITRYIIVQCIKYSIQSIELFLFHLATTTEERLENAPEPAKDKSDAKKGNDSSEKKPEKKKKEKVEKKPQATAEEAKVDVGRYTT